MSNPHGYEAGFTIEQHRDELIERLGKAIKRINELESKPIAGAGEGEGDSIVDNPGCAFSVWYFTRHFLGQDVTLEQASKSLHTESLADEYGKFLKTGKLLPPAFVASSPVEGGKQRISSLDEASMRNKPSWYMAANRVLLMFRGGHNPTEIQLDKLQSALDEFDSVPLDPPPAKAPLKELADLLTEGGAIPVINGVRWTPPTRLRKAAMKAYEAMAGTPGNRNAPFDAEAWSAAVLELEAALAEPDVLPPAKEERAATRHQSDAYSAIRNAAGDSYTAGSGVLTFNAAIALEALSEMDGLSEKIACYIESESECLMAIVVNETKHDYGVRLLKIMADEIRDKFSPHHNLTSALPQKEAAGVEQTELNRLLQARGRGSYPLWFELEVEACDICDSEDLCYKHLPIAKKFPFVESYINQLQAHSRSLEGKLQKTRNGLKSAIERIKGREFTADLEKLI